MARHLHQQRAPAVVPAAPAVVPAAPAAVPASPARESATPAAPAAPAAVLTAPARESAASAAPAAVPAAPARKSTVPAAVQQPQQQFFPVGEAMETWRGGSETESEDEQQPIKPHNANRRAMLRALYAGNNGESAIVVD